LILLFIAEIQGRFWLLRLDSDAAIWCLEVIEGTVRENLRWQVGYGHHGDVFISAVRVDSEKFVEPGGVAAMRRARFKRISISNPVVGSLISG